MDITKEDETPSGVQGIEKPDLEAPEKDRDAKWYFKCTRYYSQFFNMPFNSFEDTNATDLVYRETPVEQMIRWYGYYLGRQPNIDYNHILNVSTAATIQPIWNKGQKVAKLVDHLAGSMSEMLVNAKVTTKALSKKAKNRRSKLIEDYMTKHDAAFIFEDLKKNFGVSFAPAEPKKAITDAEELAKWAEYDYKEQGEIYAQMIANALYEKNNGYNLYSKSVKDAIIAGLTGIHHYVENGQSKQRIVRPFQAIWDSSVEDDFNKKAQFAGEVTKSTVSELIKQYGGKPKGLSESEILELKRMAKKGVDDSYIGKYGMTQNIRWYDLTAGATKTVDKITKVTMYWITLRDTRYKVSEDKYGNKNIKKLNDDKDKNKKEKGDYYVLDVCKATVIGNRFIVDWGYCNNVVRNAENKSNPELPIKFFIPNMTLDQYRSLVSRIHEYQDSIDVCQYKIKEVMGRDLGKLYIVNGNKLGSTTPRQLLTDLKSMGLTVTEGVSGEEGDPANNQKIVDYIDMTLDPNIQSYIDLRKDYEQMMEEIASVPKIALGQEVNVGLGVQQNAVQSASKGNLSLFNGFAKFVQDNLQYATNCQKNVYAIDGNTDAEWVIGERGMEYIKATKDFTFEDFLIYLKIESVIDEAARKELFDIAFNLSQNGQIDMVDWLKIKTSPNMVELENYFEYSLNKKKREAEQAQQAQMEQQIAMQQQQEAAKLQNTVVKEAGATERASDKNQLTALTEAAKLGVQTGEELPNMA